MLTCKSDRPANMLCGTLRARFSAASLTRYSSPIELLCACNNGRCSPSCAVCPSAFILTKILKCGACRRSWRHTALAVQPLNYQRVTHWQVLMSVRWSRNDSCNVAARPAVTHSREAQRSLRGPLSNSGAAVQFRLASGRAEFSHTST